MSTLLARPEIQKLVAYESARSLTTSGRVFLDANESPFAPPAGEGLNRYPDPQPKGLVDRLCELYQVTPRNLMVGRGSDEAIDLIVRVFCEAGKDQILICPPTYGMYEISAKIQNAGITRVPMLLKPTPGLDVPAIKNRINAGVKLVFLCSPNNPTGTAFDRSILKEISEYAVNQSIVVIDEAYGEFAEAESMINEINHHPNLIVLRTLSKAWAVAGARCGVAIAAEPLIALLQKVRAPYPLSQPAIETVMEATNGQSKAALGNRIALLKKERESFQEALLKMKGVQFIYPSSTNFLLIQFSNAAQVMTRARELGIILRDRSSEAGLEQCIRITMGTPAENAEVLKMLNEVLK